MKLDKNCKKEVVKLFVETSHLIGDPCLNCEVDFDNATQKFIVNGKNPFAFACVASLQRNEGIDGEEVYVVPTKELSSTNAKLLNFELGPDRVCDSCFCSVVKIQLFF